VTDAVREMLPFLLVGAFLPTWTLIVIVLLGTARPYANSLAFVAGNFAFRVALGTVVLFVLSAPSRLVPAFEVSPDVSRWLSVAGAVGFAILGVWVLARPRSVCRDETPPWMQRFERVKPGVSFMASVASVASPGVQWVYFLSAMAVLARTPADAATKVAVLVVFSALLQVMLLAPIALHAIFPERSRALLASLKNWLVRNSNRVAGVILLLLALYLARGALAGLTG